jgi:NAD+ dependent glucose-6-phosphate dehydrogenase
MPGQLLAITGGSGRIATAIRPLLRPHYRIRLLDLREPPTAPDGDEFAKADVASLADMTAGLAGAQAVLHLAGNPSTAASWDEVRVANIEGTNSVFEAARRQGARKVVLASTNHVMGFYNLERAWPIDERSAIRPDSLYGVSKAFGEALARYYADAFDMSMICLRIGWFAQIVQRCLETPRKFGIYNATSNNPQAHWALQAARDELGYAPVDDVSVFPTVEGGFGYVDPPAGVLRGERP